MEEMSDKIIEITLAQDGADDGAIGAVTVPFNQGLVISYLGLGIIVAAIFFFLRKGRQ